MAVYLLVVMVVVLLATVTSTISGKKRPRKYTQRKPKEDPAAPPCPDCPYGYVRKKRSGDKYKATCSTCYADKKNGRTRRQSSSASEEDGAAESSQQGNTGTSASTLRRSSGDIVSPPTEPCRACATGTHVERQPVSGRRSDRPAERGQADACQRWPRVLNAPSGLEDGLSVDALR